jgi:dihydroorotase
VHFFPNGIPLKLHEAHKNILAIIYDKQAFFSTEELRKLHAHFNIKNIHFDHFKSHFLKQLIVLNA